MTGPGFRVEHDSMGEVEVPADALWGAQTQRAVDNFPVSGERIGRDLIGALGCIKGAAARQDAERMRDIIRRAIAYHDADDFDIVEAWTDDARAAIQVAADADPA